MRIKLRIKYLSVYDDIALSLYLILKTEFGTLINNNNEHFMCLGVYGYIRMDVKKNYGNDKSGRTKAEMQRTDFICDV